MTSVSANTPVGQLVAENPARSRIFERLGIDYCCAGNRTLADACRTKDLDPETVAQLLDAAAEATSSDAARNWTAAPLGALIDHIESTHHAFLRRELPRLEKHLAKVTRVHGAGYPWLARVQEVFQTLKSDLEDHMQSEEEIVFPAIRKHVANEAEEASQDGDSTLEAPIKQMIHEHDEAGDALETMNELTNGYSPPDGACATFRATLDGLRELEMDMHQHVHKENNILFPRARSLM